MFQHQSPPYITRNGGCSVILMFAFQVRMMLFRYSPSRTCAQVARNNKRCFLWIKVNWKWYSKTVPNASQVQTCIQSTGPLRSLHNFLTIIIAIILKSVCYRYQILKPSCSALSVHIFVHITHKWWHGLT